MGIVVVSSLTYNLADLTRPQQRARLRRVNKGTYKLVIATDTSHLGLFASDTFSFGVDCV
eukprot:7346963-Pyramimonas_sp.AAC.1